MDTKNSFVMYLPRKIFLKSSIKSVILIAVALTLLVTFFSCSRLKMAGGREGADPQMLDKIISNKFSSVELAHLPTPLEELNVLSSELNGPKLYIKRDDQTGLAFGGNKARKLEFIIADVINKKADVIITSAGIQSNWCRQTAAAAKMFGIEPILVLSKKDEAPVSIYDGNLLLDFILGADIRLVNPDENRTEIVDQITEEETEKGHNPYIIPVGGSRVGGSMMEPLGAIAYTKAFLEIYNEAQKRKIKIDYVVHATGSGGTQAGLVLGAKAVDPNIKIVGISVSGAKASTQRNVAQIANNVAEVLGLEIIVSPEEVIVFDEYVGEGYGILNQEIADAISLLARKEGIILEPVYTGKAMYGLLDLIKKGYFNRDDGVVFIHTGGTPALFTYKEELMEFLKKK